MPQTDEEKTLFDHYAKVAQQPTELIDVTAGALWQAEALRATGRLRTTEWANESPEERFKYHFSAACALDQGSIPVIFKQIRSLIV